MNLEQTLTKIKTALGEDCNVHVRLDSNDMITISVWWRNTKQVFSQQFTTLDWRTDFENRIIDTFIERAKAVKLQNDFYGLLAKKGSNQ